MVLQHYKIERAKATTENQYKRFKNTRPKDRPEDGLKGYCIHLVTLQSKKLQKNMRPQIVSPLNIQQQISKNITKKNRQGCMYIHPIVSSHDAMNAVKHVICESFVQWSSTTYVHFQKHDPPLPFKT
jgi:hypothetical protein